MVREREMEIEGESEMVEMGGDDSLLLSHGEEEEEEKEEDEEEEGGGGRKRWMRETKQQLGLAAPMVCSSILIYSLPLVSVMVVGHLGRLALSSASVAVSFANISGFSVLMGMSCALETLCGQAYGAKNYHLVGVFLHRAVLVLMLASIPLAIVWANVGSILLALGQEEAISLAAGDYMLWLIPSLFAYAFSQPLLKFLQTQSLVAPMVTCATISLCFHAPLCWFLVYRTSLGSNGAAISSSISNWIYTIALYTYVSHSSACEMTRAPLSRESVQGLGSFLKLAIPAAFMLCLEWWSYEILLLFSGLLPDPELSSSVLSIRSDSGFDGLNTIAVVFMIPYSIGAAVSTRVSNELGAGHPRAARLAVFVSLSLVLVETLIIAIAIFALRHVLGWSFSSDAGVISYIAEMAPLLAFSTILDGFQEDFSGVIRGCGWQRLGAFINLGSFYVVGLPISFVLAFVFHFGDKGLWIGIICGCACQGIFYWSVILTTDWHKEAITTSSRVNEYLEYENGKIFPEDQ